MTITVNTRTDAPTMDHHLAIKYLRSTVAGNEDYVYCPPRGSIMCVYTDPLGRGSCLVGKALRAFYPQVQFMYNRAISTHTEDFPVLTGLNLTQQAIAVLRRAQRVQDNRKSWKEALAAAEEQYERILLDDTV